MSVVKTAQRGGREVLQLWQQPVSDCVQEFAWSDDQRYLASITVDGRIHVFDLQGTKLWEPESHTDSGASIAWRPMTSEFTTIGHDGRVCHWDAAVSRKKWEARSGAAWGTRVAWRRGGSLLASAAGRVLRIWNADGELQRESSDHDSTITDLGWNPDGSAVAVSAYNGVTLHILGKSFRKFTWKGSSLALAWSPGGKFIVTGEQDASVHVWHVKTGHDSQMTGFATKVRELSWHYSGNFLATGGSDSIVLWDCSGKGPEGRTPRILESHANRLTQLAFQHQGDQIASADLDGIVMLWNPLSDIAPYYFRGFDSEITRVAWSQADQQLAIGEVNGTITVLGFKK